MKVSIEQGCLRPGPSCSPARSGPSCSPARSGPSCSPARSAVVKIFAKPLVCISPSWCSRALSPKNQPKHFSALGHTASHGKLGCGRFEHFAFDWSRHCGKWSWSSSTRIHRFFLWCGEPICKWKWSWVWNVWAVLRDVQLWLWWTTVWKNMYPSPLHSLAPCGVLF